MAITVSFHGGNNTKISRDHNIRNPKYCVTQTHIDLNGHHEIWKDQRVTHFYRERFEEARQEYNKGKPKCRQIADYYKHVKDDKQKHTHYEVIIEIGSSNSPADRKDCYEVYKEFMAGWEERNPNLELLGVYYHDDEPESQPHLHVDYVPIANNCKRGLSTQVSLSGALKEMGFEGKGYSLTAQTLWQHRERALLRELCEERGYEVIQPLKGQKKKSLELSLYKIQSRIDKQEEKSAKLTEEIDELEELRSLMSSKASSMEDESRALEKQIEDLEKKRDHLKSVEMDYGKDAAALSALVRKAYDDFRDKNERRKKYLKMLGLYQGLGSHRFNDARERIDFLVEAECGVDGDPDQKAAFRGELENMISKAERYYMSIKKVEKGDPEMIKKWGRKVSEISRETMRMIEKEHAWG